MINDLTSGQDLSAQQLVEHLAPASHVLVGVQADNPDHLALQLWLLQSLAQRRAQGSFLLAMLTPCQQARVGAVQGGIAQGEYPVDLLAALGWHPEWNWAFYGPLMRYALAQPYRLLAADLHPDEAQAIQRRPQRLSGMRSTAPAVRHRLLAHISHRYPEEMGQSMLAVHQQRDRRMAQALLDAPLPALLLAGADHVRKDIGVPLHMADLVGKAEPTVLILAHAGTTVDAEAADYVWYTTPPSSHES